METPNKVIEKVKKLLAKASSTDSKEEAESLFLKANKLIIKWRIDKSQLADEENDETIETNQILCGEISLEGKWEVELMMSLSRYNDCKFTYRGKKQYIITLYGSPVDIELVKYFFESARTAFRHLSRLAYNEKKREVSAEHPDLTIKDCEKLGFISYRSVFVRSFLAGACAGLGRKIALLKAETVVEYDTTGSYALIATNQLEKVGRWLKENVKTKNMNQAGAKADLGAMMAGTIAGTNHSLSLALETNTAGFNGKELS